MHEKKITQTLLPIIIGLLTMMQFACSDDNKSGGSGNGPLKLTTFIRIPGTYPLK